MAKTKLRYGMVGGGIGSFIGEVHRKAAGMDGRMALCAGCFSQNAERNAQTGCQCGLDAERVYASYAAMASAEAAREDGIDFVSIVTPNDSHYEIAKAFLQAGVHIVCEKPLCLTAAQAQELSALARRNDCLFAVSYTYPGYTMSRVMRQMIADGAIGEIVAVNAEYAQDWLLDELSPQPQQGNYVWRMDPAVSGASNCVADIGTHIACFVHYVTGLPIRRVAATVNRYGRLLDLNANILVEYENGVNGAYWCSQVAAGHANGLVVRVYGTRGSLQWHQETPDLLRFAPKGEPVRVLERGGHGVPQPAGSGSRLPVGHPEGLYVAFANIYRDFAQALLQKQNGLPYDTGSLTMVEEGVAGVRFVEAVIASAADGSAWTAV